MKKEIIIFLAVGFTAVNGYLFFANTSQKNARSVLAEPMLNSGDTNVNVGSISRNSTSISQNDAAIVASIDEAKEKVVVVVESVLDEQVKMRDALVDVALERLQSGNPGEMVRGMMELIENSPTETVNTLFSMLDKLQEQPGAEGIVALGLLSLASKPNILSNEDVEYIYSTYDNDNLKARAARVLFHRGDKTLLTEYVNKYDSALHGDNLEEKTAALDELGYLQAKMALPKILPSLNDSNEIVRIKALSALSMAGNGQEIESIRPLLYDVSAAVRAKAESVLEILTSKGEDEPMPTEILLSQSSMGS